MNIDTIVKEMSWREYFFHSGFLKDYYGISLFSQVLTLCSFLFRQLQKLPIIHLFNALEIGVRMVI